jgi:hypothetical protein
MCKSIIIGDSSALPREDTSFNNTYYAMLSKNLKIENSAIVNNNSYKIFVDLEAFLLYGYDPDVVILNYGIVDAYPRPYPNKIYRLLACSGLLPYVDKFLKRTKLYYKIGDIFNFKEVPLKKFEYYTEGIIKKLLLKKVNKIIIIGIMRPYKILRNSKIADRNIKLYNSVYREMAKRYTEVVYIDIYNDSDKDFTIWDGYHYSKKASLYLAEKIENLIKND